MSPPPGGVPSDEETARANADGAFEFEATLDELERIIDRLDREGLGLDEAIELFERGIDRLGTAKRWLESASGRIEELVASSSGEMETLPFEGDEGPASGGVRAIDESAGGTPRDAEASD